VPPSIPLFGSRECVYGIDLGTFGGKTECVHGLAVRINTGGVERQMNGVEVGVISAGIMNGTDFRESCINGMLLSGLACECGTANGILASGLGSRAQRVNGLQLGLWNGADDVRGLQIGLYNEAKSVKGAQIGLVNWRENAPCPYLPLLRVVLD